MNGLLSGEIKVALCALSYAVYRYREIEKAPIEGIWPAEGVPVNLAPLVILAGAPHPNAAKLFVDWAFSAEGQHEMSRLVGAYSARRDVPSPVGQPAWGSFNALLVKDWRLFASSLGEFRESWRAATR
jgi:ABC-type Fe3+ transport system substrate-binding protein